MPDNANSSNVKKIPQIVYNTMGKTPAGAFFPTSISEVKNYLVAVATEVFGQQIPEKWVHLIITKNEDASRFDAKTKRNVEDYKRSWQILIPKSINILTNTREDALLSRVIGDYNQKVVEFVKKYSKLNDKKGGRLEDAIKSRGDHYVFELSWEGVFEQMFDASGYYYQKAFGVKDKDTYLKLVDVVKDSHIDYEHNCYKYGSRGEPFCDGEDFLAMVYVYKLYITGASQREMMPITHGKHITIY